MLPTSPLRAAPVWAVRLLVGLAVVLALAVPSAPRAQEAAVEVPATEAEAPRQATGGAQSLEDILARQRGEAVGNEFRRPAGDDSAAAAEAIRGQLGTRGSESDADVFRQIRFGTSDVTVSTGRPVDRVLVQDNGMRWLEWREGPVARWGLIALGGMLALLALFYLLRGRIRIEAGRAGVLIERFGGLERFGHWLLAGSFVLLAITGLVQFFGRTYLIPLIGKEAFSTIAIAGKWIHNNVAWAFMVALIFVFAAWAWQNIPNRHDVVWLIKGGGMFSRHGHAPARKFNAGQKILFWLVILLGVSVSLSGLSLLVPFELPMFAKTFAVINQSGGLVGIAPGLPTELQPHEEMQYAQIWHVIVGFAMMVMILGHIYIGTLGMEGAFDAMGSGEVDLNWAREHHGLWVEQLEDQGRVEVGARRYATPAE